MAIYSTYKTSFYMAVVLVDAMYVYFHFKDLTPVCVLFQLRCDLLVLERDVRWTL